MTCSQNVHTNDLTKIYIGSDQDDHATDTYTEIKGTSEATASTPVGGEQEITEKKLFCGNIKIGGTIENGEVELKYVTNLSDAGQALLNQRRHNNAIYNFKYTKNNAVTNDGSGQITYFKGRIISAGEIDVKAGEISESMAKIVVAEWLPVVAAT